MTYETLLRVGASVFSHRGFRRASVAEICRRSRVANGTFYQYFPDKAQLFLTLIEQMTNQLQTRLESAVAPAAPAIEQLHTTLKTHLEFIGAHTALYRVFREAEFVQIEPPQQLYGRLARFYQKILQDGQNTKQLRRLDLETVSFSLIGMAEFIALRYIFWDCGLPPHVWETLRGLISYGISSERPCAPAGPSDFSPPPEEKIAEPSQGQRTRAKLLEAAEAEFGEKGFYEAQIVDITRRAGVAHGTFYTYFPSKEAIFVELVQEINKQLRARLRAAIAGLGDRRQIERAGFRAFFDFIKDHARAYRIVREAEFVGSPKNAAGRWYYERLAQGYVPALAHAMKVRQIRSSDPEALAYALMGIGHFIGLRWVLWERQAVPNSVFENMMDFILHGLLPT
ncbi:MAG: TetR/AcrR family transcriptional regulator [Candidatus Bipolaricaulota bacterium]|nr:TetR/AcrR family transcriptional regulator [Candidatus Bipolaricaulota bacterium]MDW8030666.1 TetR/AcrR family transcriptional regulator [Candidatus Bipolaricaulota bacterium]